MDTGRRRGCTLIAVTFLLCCGANGFNLEPRIPIIKVGNRGSYFGFSVAEHKAVDDVNTTVTHNWMLVGAPLDRNLQPETNHSGALWRCPITQRRDDCDQVQTDGKRDRGGYYEVDSKELSPPMSDEIKDGQWLGVTVRSRGVGGKVLVCAHRYVRSGLDFQWGQGLCYTLNQYLDLFEAVEPCKGRPVNRAHEQFGYCQAGTSGAVVDDDVVIGTPGPHTWRGTVFVKSVTDVYLERDKMTYFGPLQEGAPVDKYSYLGMSVAAGNFFGDELSYAGGAPRSNGTGQVVLFTKKKSVTQLIVKLVLSGELFASSFGYEVAAADVNCDKIPDLIVGAPFYHGKDVGGAIYVYLNNIDHCLDCAEPVKITGKRESRFGFAITSLGDLDMNGCEDIAVGAPYEGNGTVYVYLGSPKGLITEPSQVIHSEDLPDKRGPVTFGHSLSGGVDLDENGYPDLLVGAYEDDKVVLIRSRPIIGININIGDRYLKNIDPTRTGCARYPNSNWTCFTFEACFTIESATNAQLSSNQILTLKYHLEAETFAGRKFSRVWLGDNYETRPSVLERRISASLKHCSSEVAYLKENTRDIQSPIQFKLTYTLVQEEPRIESEYGPLPPIDRYPILNQQKAAHVFAATFQKDCGDNDICESNLVTISSLNLTRGKDGRWELMLGQLREISLNVTVRNDGESAYETQLFVTHHSNLSYIGRKTEGKQFPCDPFNKTTVVCSIGNPFKKGSSGSVLLRFDPKGLDDTTSLLEFVVLVNSTSDDMNDEGPKTLQASVVKKAELSLKGSARPEQVLYGGVIKGESAMVYFDDVGSRVIHTYQVFNNGPWKASKVDIYIEWPFQVANNKPQGKWLLYLEEEPTIESRGGGQCDMIAGQVNPLGLKVRQGLNETPLETPSRAGVKDSSFSEGGERQGTVTGTWDEDEEEEDSFEEDENEEENIIEDGKKRSKRDTEMVLRPEAIIDKDGRRTDVVTMSCPIGSAKCIKFKCRVFNLGMNQEATIRVKARLWNSTLVGDYPHVGWVRIGSRATIHVPDDLGIHQDTGDDVAQVDTLAYPDLLDQQEPEPVPIWIIIFSVLLGILLLIILILVLWKIGFFKRKRPTEDPTLVANIEKRNGADYS
ncbi:integrin alpha-PS1 isoform X1 [Hetaerina americana]|uniref:integrin alpha-PS1 isoform X1 n=1 Tax=Hetaerina americana TaxID=62018 RepID=UPI003A7F3903